MIAAMFSRVGQRMFFSLIWFFFQDIKRRMMKLDRQFDLVFASEINVSEVKLLQSFSFMNYFVGKSTLEDKQMIHKYTTLPM